MKKEKPDKIRILRILNRFNVGGPVWNVALLTKFLPEEYETKLVGGKATSNEADAQGILDELDIEANIIPSLSREVNLSNDLKSFLALRKIIQEFKPHLVHTHASKAGFLGRLAAFTKGVPIVIHTYHGHVFEGYFGPVKTEIIRKMERLLARKTTAIVTISLSQKEAITKKFNICPVEKTHIIPLGFDLSRFYPNEPQRAIARKTYHLANDTMAICIVGRLTAIKNHPLFLKAAAILLSNSSINYRFFVVGDGETKTELRQLCLEYGIESEVVFTSWIHSMERFYPAMDIACLTSLNEGTPVTLIEAQAAGIPVISTKVGGVENTMIDGRTGLILDSFSPDELAEKIEGLARDINQRRQMSKNAHTFAKEQFSYHALVKNMDVLYKKLLKDV
jgi:glycosyltransferase involved in cell wall biosynthesis